MLTGFILIPTDTQCLDGAFYEHEGGAIAEGMQLSRGDTMDFHRGAVRFLPPVPVETIAHCDHFCNGRGQTIQECVNAWSASWTGGSASGSAAEKRESFSMPQVRDRHRVALRTGFHSISERIRSAPRHVNLIQWEILHGGER
ncbi:MAG: hypothetical protein AB1558_08520 [Thermodesulfobacteriota bacterium]